MASRGFLARYRIFGAVALLAAALSVAPHARAGNGSYSGIAAATLDGKFAALFFVSYGSECEPGALAKTANEMRNAWALERTVDITTCTGRERMPPFSRWKWSKKPPEARALHAFADLYDDKSAGKRARVARDDDTGVFRLEIFDADRWWPVRALVGAPPKVTGTLHLQGRYLIRVHRSENIEDWDEVFAFSEAEVPDVRKRFEHERTEAASRTRLLRELRIKGELPFNTPPKSRRNRDYWEYRRGKIIDPAIRSWELAASYGPLEAKDLADMIWLLAVRAAPGQRLEALRMVIGLRQRDAKAVDLLLAALEKDATTAGLVPLLKSDFDPIRKLALSRFDTLTVGDLRAFSDQELAWVHRLIWASAGFHFSDPHIADYFALFPWYQPIREKEWRPLLEDPFFRKDYDRSVLVAYDLTLKALKRVEKERGLAPPPL
jgi:hypothetical protein